LYRNSSNILQWAFLQLQSFLEIDDGDEDEDEDENDYYIVYVSSSDEVDPLNPIVYDGQWLMYLTSTINNVELVNLDSLVTNESFEVVNIQLILT